MDYEYRNRLMSQGTIHYLGGKQELMYRGGLDDTDMVLQCHMMEMESGKCCILDTKGNGFISKTVHFLGRQPMPGLPRSRESRPEHGGAGHEQYSRAEGNLQG